MRRINDIKIFENERFGAIRTVEQSGEPWFVGKDIAVALRYNDPWQAVRYHVDADNKGV